MLTSEDDIQPAEGQAGSLGKEAQEHFPKSSGETQADPGVTKHFCYLAYWVCGPLGYCGGTGGIYIPRHRDLRGSPKGLNTLGVIHYLETGFRNWGKPTVVCPTHPIPGYWF